MAQTSIDICNQALALVGGEAISAFDDGSNEGAQCGKLYETVVRAALTNPGNTPFRWSFASRQEPLARLVATPDARWPAGWQTPVLCLQIHAVTDADTPVRFAIYGDKIFTDEHTELVCDHTFRAEEAAWPAFFEAEVVTDLARKLAMALREDPELAAELRRSSNWAGARTADSQQRTSQRLRFTRLKLQRFAR